jgi:hypothetical protein
VIIKNKKSIMANKKWNGEVYWKKQQFKKNMTKSVYQIHDKVVRLEVRMTRYKIK